MNHSGFLELVLISGVCTCSSSCRATFIPDKPLSDELPLSLPFWDSAIHGCWLSVCGPHGSACVCVCMCFEHVELSFSYLVSTLAHKSFYHPIVPMAVMGFCLSLNLCIVTCLFIKDNIWSSSFKLAFVYSCLSLADLADSHVPFFLISAPSMRCPLLWPVEFPESLCSRWR